ncbi:hypothetical protein BC833DRAFT_612018 [Globomyces pollinis-pini]|nr:hypothetical protein BC833DRAFT_612018 [Globomyces pollinis-pini]
MKFQLLSTLLVTVLAKDLYYECKPESIVTPTTTEQVQQVIVGAIATGKKVKAYAAGHSRNKVLCTKGITMITTSLNQLISIDRIKNTVTVGAGMTLKTLNDLLQLEGRMMVGVPDYGGITVGGSIGTGGHGSSLKYPSATHDYMVAAKLVDGTGQIINITEDHPDFPAFRVNLGALGILTEITLNTLPLQKLYAKNIELDFNDATLNMVDIVKQYDFANVFYFPYNKKAIIATFTGVDPTTPGNGYKTAWDSPSLPIPASVTQWVTQKAVDTLNKLANQDQICALENLRYNQFKNPDTSEQVGYFGPMFMGRLSETSGPVVSLESSFPISVLSDALIDIGKILEKTKACFPLFGVYTRFGLPSKTLIGSNHKEAVAHLEVHILRPEGIPYLGFSAIDEIRQLLTVKYGGEPHFGKNWASDFTQLSTRLGDRGLQFIKTVQKYDPNGLFDNEFMKNFVPNAPRLTTPKCGLTQDCICERNLECPNQYVCDSGRFFTQAKVCRKGSGAGCQKDDECNSNRCFLLKCR